MEEQAVASGAVGVQPEGIVAVDELADVAREDGQEEQARCEAEKRAAAAYDDQRRTERDLDEAGQDDDDVLVEPDPIGHLRLEIDAGKRQVAEPGDDERATQDHPGDVAGTSRSSDSHGSYRTASSAPTGRPSATARNGEPSMRCHDERMSLRAVLASVLAVPAMVACGDDQGGRDARRVDATETRPVTTSTLAATGAMVTTSPPPTIPVATAPPGPAPTTTPSRPVLDVITPADAALWRVTNDTVMGGASSGELAVSEGTLVFTGVLSLANGGGFASIRSPEIDPQVALGWVGHPGPRVQVDGDGRTWTLEFRTHDGSGGWIRSFPTSPDGLTDVELPWRSFEPVTRFLEPRSADEPLDPGGIVSIAFYLVDGTAGPYRLAVRSIT